jgi:DNA-binding NarL/FixJ family response regulator
MTIRVLLADDQALIRAGFKALIDSASDLIVVAEAATGAEAVTRARTSRADIVLMDIRMPDMDGIAATRAITTDDDMAGVRVVILTTFEIDDLVIRAIQAGASGFLGKGVDPAGLLDAIRVVASGEALLSPRATSGLLAQLRHQDRPLPTIESEQFDALTPRERELTTLVATGLNNDDIAERLYLSPLTVKTHINRAMMKLGVRDRAQLVALAYEGGLVQPGHRT